MRIAALMVVLVLAGCTVRSQHEVSMATDPERVDLPGVPAGRVVNFPTIDPADGSLWFSWYAGDAFDQQTIVRAPRVGGGWGEPVLLPAPVNSPQAEIHAAATAAGDLFVPSRRPGGLGVTDLGAPASTASPSRHYPGRSVSLCVSVPLCEACCSWST